MKVTRSAERQPRQASAFAAPAAELLHQLLHLAELLDQPVDVLELGAGAAGDAAATGADLSDLATFHYGDIVRGRVISLLNSNIHLTLAEKEYGLLYAQCFMCGGDTVRTNESTIKCVDCGAFENRKLAHDYGKESVRLVYKAGK